jgi:hypothetical protein
MGRRTDGPEVGSHLMPRLMFGPWEPDKPPYLTEALATALNVYAGPNGYRPIRQFSAASGGTLVSTCLGAASFVAPQGASSIVAGTQIALYRAQLSGWEEIGNGYGLQPDGRWRFAQFGGLAIASNGSDAMVKIDLTTAETAPLGGDPPTARNLMVVKDFLVALVLNGDVQTLGWSAINNAEWWTWGQNQSDYQIMPSGGEITGGFGGEVGIVLQRGRITRMTYVGDNVVFQFDEVSSNVGCVSMNSTAQWGTLGFFLSDTGFMMWDGASIRPIGHERVDRYFASLYSHTSLSHMSTAIDPVNSIVAWSMQDRVLLYNWVLDRWTVSDLAASIIFPGYTRDIALDELDTPYPVIDGMPISLDDPFFKGGDPRFYVINSSNTIGTLAGTNMAVSIEGNAVELTPGREARIQRVRPISDTESLTVGIATTQRLGQAYVSTDYTGLTESGDLAVRERGRFSKFSLDVAAGVAWTFAQGLDVEMARGARR